MTTETARVNLELLLEELDIPPTAYDKAEARYKDLGEFFAGENAACAAFDPHIHPQGSFRLGTVVRPLGTTDEYDLDVGCRLTNGIKKETQTQQQLKDLVGADLLKYRDARGIHHALEEKRRCWRMQYKDEMKFHMDVVPSIPEDDKRRYELFEAMAASGSQRELAASVASHAGAVTDNESSSYRRISPDWKVSNSEGYAIWFESRMLLARTVLEKNAALAKTTIAELPSRRWGSPLQQAIRLLKRHRDCMFAENTDAKPISVIITTLAARAYKGETDLSSAIEGILARMSSNLFPNIPRVPNPVNPSEDFADKWAEPKHSHLHLEENFHLWLHQAQVDFKLLREANPEFLVEQVALKFGATLGGERVRQAHGSVGQTVASVAPAVITTVQAKPWARG